jgi:hypothetical protein
MGALAYGSGIEAPPRVLGICDEAPPWFKPAGVRFGHDIALFGHKIAVNRS